MVINSLPGGCTGVLTLRQYPLGDVDGGGNVPDSSSRQRARIFEMKEVRAVPLFPCHQEVGVC
jgi:hypothetical protein